MWLPLLLGKESPSTILQLGTLGPTIAALIAHRITNGNWRAVRVRSPLRSFLIGTALGGSAFLAAAFVAAFFMTESGVDRWRWGALTQILTLFIPNLIGGPLTEEAGWRGFALPRLQGRFNPTLSSLILGIAWAIWHVPLIFRHYNLAWWQFILLTVAASIFLSLAFNYSGGSALSAVLVHGVYNVGTGVILNDMLSKANLLAKPTCMTTPFNTTSFGWLIAALQCSYASQQEADLAIGPHNRLTGRLWLLSKPVATVVRDRLASGPSAWLCGRAS